MSVAPQTTEVNKKTRVKIKEASYGSHRHRPNYRSADKSPYPMPAILLIIPTGVKAYRKPVNIGHI
jgi:hypothetical protein